MMKTTLRVGFLLLLAALLLSTAYAGPCLNYQGRLADNLGAAATSGYYEIEFRIWDHPTSSEASDLIWGRAFAVPVVEGGLFNARLHDEGAPVTPEPPVASLADAFEDEERYLGLTVIETPTGPVATPREITSRERLVSVAYAFHAQHATKAVTADDALNTSNALTAADSDQLGGLPPSGYIHHAQFPGPQSPPKMFLWDGSAATAVNAWLDDGTLMVEYALHPQSLTLNGALRPSTGDDPARGIEFPHPADADDRAWVKRYANTTEGSLLSIGVGNDHSDDLEVLSSGDLSLHSTRGGTIYLSGAQVSITGTVSAIGPWEHKASWTSSDVGTNYPNEVAASDGFLLVDLQAARVQVNMQTPHTLFWVLLSADSDSDRNYGSRLFPIAAGDSWSVAFLHTHSGTNPMVNIFWRALGK